MEETRNVVGVASVDWRSEKRSENKHPYPGHVSTSLFHRGTSLFHRGASLFHRGTLLFHCGELVFRSLHSTIPFLENGFFSSFTLKCRRNNSSQTKSAAERATVDITPARSHICQGFLSLFSAKDLSITIFATLLSVVFPVTRSPSAIDIAPPPSPRARAPQFPHIPSQAFPLFQRFTCGFHSESC